MDEQPEHDAILSESPVERDGLYGAEVKFDAEGRVDQDLYCLKCGYNLRTLQSEGRCPECNIAVSRSVLGNALYNCDPKWVARLALGIAWIMWGIVVGVGALLVLRMLSEASVSLLVPGIFFYGFVFIGSWLLTTPNKGGCQEPSGISSRKLVRASLLALLGCILAESIAIAIKADTTYTYYCLVVFTLAWYLTSLAFCRRLAVLLGDRQLVKQFRVLILGAVLFVVPIASMEFVAVFLLSRGGGLICGVACIVMLGVAACFVWSLHLLDWLKEGLKDAAVRAKENWADDSGVGE